jgi:hypothetical protein
VSMRLVSVGPAKQSQSECQLSSSVLSLPVSFVEWRFGNYARVA